MKPATNGASRMPARSQAPRAKPAAPAANRMPPRPGMGMLFVCNFYFVDVVVLQYKRGVIQSIIFNLSRIGGVSNAAANAQIEDLSNQLMESKLTIEGLEKERDFYFSKLRDIEVLAQEHENDGGEFVQKALAV